MPLLDVILSPPEIDLLPERDLADTVAVVFDVLRATSTMVTALAAGAMGIWPVRTIEEAWEFKKKRPEALLGGERHGERIEGFDLGNSPLEYGENVRGREIISTTTNGTLALRAVEHASAVSAASILNAGAVVSYLEANRESKILLVCAGTFREAALEDIFAAGLIISMLSGRQLTDSAELALAFFHQEAGNIEGALRRGRNGRALIAKGRAAEVAWCAQQSIYPLFAQMTKDGFVQTASL